MKSTIATLPRNAVVEIWDRLIPPGRAIPSVAARWLQGLAFSDFDISRMKILAAKAQEGRLSDEEHAEMELFEQIGDMLSILKAKSRTAVKPRVKAR